MKPVSGPLAALLATREFLQADLFEITYAGGAIDRYTDFDRDLVWAANTYNCGGQTGPFFNAGPNRARSSWSRGLQVRDLIFDVAMGEGLARGFPFVVAINYGLFDGATMRRLLAYMAPAAPTTVVGVILMDSGRVADVGAQGSVASFTVRPRTELLDISLPRNLFQAGCNHVLFDAGCGLNRASFAVAGTVEAGSTADTIKTTLAAATGYYDIGSIEFTTGQLAGLGKTVKRWTNGHPGTMTLIGPFPVAPAIGDAFTAYPGCDLTTTTCTAKFANLANFGGMPYIPVPETAV